MAGRFKRMPFRSRRAVRRTTPPDAVHHCAVHPRFPAARVGRIFRFGPLQSTGCSDVAVRRFAVLLRLLDAAVHAAADGIDRGELRRQHANFGGAFSPPFTRLARARHRCQLVAVGVLQVRQLQRRQPEPGARHTLGHRSNHFAHRHFVLHIHPDRVPGGHIPEQGARVQADSAMACS